MKLYELLEDAITIINDKTRVLISIQALMPSGAHGWVIVAAGNWFQDQILAYDQHDIIEYTLNLQQNALSIHCDGDLEI